MRILTILGFSALTLILTLTHPAKTLAAEHHIGASLPLSGKQEPEGKAMQLALELYVETLNEAGGINGTPVKLVIKDDANDKDKARANAQAFADDSQILAVIGHQFSSVAMAGGEAYDKGQLPHISPSASNPAVTSNIGILCGMRSIIGPQDRSVPAV